MILNLSDTVLAYAGIKETGREGERRTVAMILPELFPGLDRGRLFVGHYEDGCPYLSGYAGFVSVSHSGRVAVVARNDSHPIGVDVESPRIQLERVSHKFVGENDFKPGIMGRMEWLLRLWTAKEAVYKAARVRGTALADIMVVSPTEAVIPDGRGYRLTVYPLAGDLLTLAEEVRR